MGEAAQPSQVCRDPREPGDPCGEPGTRCLETAGVAGGEKSKWSSHEASGLRQEVVTL